MLGQCVIESNADHQSYVQHYIANLMLGQCVIESNAEVWTCQFGGNSIGSLQ